MTLQLSKERPYKAYVKKLNNGFGIKTINTLSGVENILVITADSLKDSHSDKKLVDSKCQILRPLFAKFSEETVSATLSIQSINRPKFTVSKVLSHLEPYIKEIKPDIAGFHIFEGGDTKSSPNVQKTSVIFVANTELARKKGVHFNIPGELMNMFLVDGENKEGKIKFKADSVVKPLTIVVSDYVLHINICYDVPSKSQNKSVGTQTKKRYILSSSVDDEKPVYKIESFLHSGLQVTPEQKFTQTDSSILVEDSQSSQTNTYEHYQDESIQTVFFKDQISYTSRSSSDRKSSCECNEFGLTTDEGNYKTESYGNSSKQTIDFGNSLNSFKSYDSHANIYQSTVLNRMNNEKVYEMASMERKEVKDTTTPARKKEKTTVTLFDNSSNYNVKTKNSDNTFENIKSKYSSNLTVSTSTKSASFDGDRSETSLNRLNSDNGMRIIGSRSNVSIKDIKERLNKTTLSLQQLYSVVELLEKKSLDKSSKETTDCIVREQVKDKTAASRQTSMVMTSQATSEESSRTNSTDRCAYLQELLLGNNQSNSKSDYEKSLKDYEDTSSADILCERCGSFHTDVSFEGNCKTNELIENKGCLGDFDNCSSPLQKNFPNSVFAIANNILPDEMESCKSSDNFSNDMQNRLENLVTDSKTSCREHNYLTLNTSSQCIKSKKNTESNILDKDNLDNDAFQNIVACQRKSYERLENNEYKNTFCKNHSSNYEKHTEETVINRKEFELDEKIATVSHSFADCERLCKDNNPSSQSLVEKECILTNKISCNENCTSEECIVTSTGSINSTHGTSLHDNLEDSYKNSSCSSVLSNKSIEVMCDSKTIAENNANKNLNVSDTVLLLSQKNSLNPKNSKKSSSKTIIRNENKSEAKSEVFYFTEVKNTKSWISFKKSSKSCNFKETLGVKGKTTSSEPIINNQLKIKNLSSGDHLHDDSLCKVSSGLEERLNTIGLFNNNKSNFLNSKNSSSSTLHIIPSSLELLKLKSQEGNCEDRGELSKNTIEEVKNKSPSFKKCVRSQGNCNKKENENLSCASKCRYIKLENKLLGNNNIDCKTVNSSKNGKRITQKKCAKIVKQNSKPNKKSKLFCFLI